MHAPEKPTIEVLGIYLLDNKEEILDEELRTHFSATTTPPDVRAQRRKYVRELVDCAVLVEVLVRNRDDQFDAGQFTQDVPKNNLSQVAWSETYLTPDGDSIIETSWPGVPDGQTLRVAFYLHDWEPSRPLATSYGACACPPPQPMPERLARLVPYQVPG